MTENRQKFFDRLVILPESALLDIGLAYILAKYAHRAQVRKEKDEKGELVRYFEHPRRVALILIDELHIVLPEMIIAALLHDGIEDTREITPASLERYFGPEVTTIVRQLSKVPKEGFAERLLNLGNWKALVLKACDRLDNLRSLSAGTVDFQRKQIRETKEVYYPIFARLLEIVPNEYRNQAVYLKAQIELLIQETEERLVQNP